MTKEEAIKTLQELWRETNDSWYEEAYDMAIEALSAEVVEVVRCKDCRHQRFYINDNESFCCDKSGVVNMHMDDGDGEFFCKYGVRKE